MTRSHQIHVSGGHHAGQLERRRLKDGKLRRVRESWTRDMLVMDGDAQRGNAHK